MDVPSSSNGASAVRAAPWVSYRRGIDLGWRPIESPLRPDPLIDPPQADVELNVLLHHTGFGLLDLARLDRLRLFSLHEPDLQLDECSP